jgi:hypothetical protein
MFCFCICTLLSFYIYMLKWFVSIQTVEFVVSVCHLLCSVSLFGFYAFTSGVCAAIWGEVPVNLDYEVKESYPRNRPWRPITL